MTAEAIHLRGRHELRKNAAAAIASGEVHQMPDGRAGVFTGLCAAAANDRTNWSTDGQKTVAKTASQVWVDGCELWWDHSANSATCIPQYADKDFYLGCAVGDAASAATEGVVNLNVKPSYIIDLHESGGDTAIIKTVVGSTTVEVPNLVMRGGSAVANFGTTAEAQKVDWLSKRSFPLASNWILDADIEVIVNADADVADLSVGVANATADADAEAITEFVLVHLDMGADLNIDVDSDDGTTDVGITDSTVDWVLGTPFHVTIDGRDPSDVQVYINGVLVLAATTFTLAAATGPLKALFHLEKSSNDSPGTVHLDNLKVRIQE
jgi:predicted RecA/RadA family phage recombinase